MPLQEFECNGLWVASTSGDYKDRIWIRDSVFEINQRDIEYRKAITSSMRMTNKKFHTTIQGMTGHDRLSEKQQEAREEYKQLVWLYKG